jgi:hypothetical protein
LKGEKHMKRFFRVDLKNGNFKDFDSEEKAKAYEEELYCKEQQEIERQKKIADERKRSEETEKRLLKELNDDYVAFAKKAGEFEKTTGKKLIYTYTSDTGDYELKATRNTLDFAYDNGFQRLLNILGI